MTTRVLFFVVLVMALVSLRSQWRARLTYVRIGVRIPRHIEISLLNLGAVGMLAAAMLVGLGTPLGMSGLIVSGVLAGLALWRRYAGDHTPHA